MVLNHLYTPTLVKFSRPPLATSSCLGFVMVHGPRGHLEFLQNGSSLSRRTAVALPLWEEAPNVCPTPSRITKEATWATQAQR